MNQKLLDKAALLPAEEIAKERGAFFSSILGTLNHIYVADLLWLNRIAGAESFAQQLQGLDQFLRPESLREIHHEEINQLAQKRGQLDELLLSFVNGLDDEHLKEPIEYKNMKNEQQKQPLGSLLQHLFNHQTHHRGQATTLLFQAGIDPEVTDMLVMMMEEGA